MRPPMQHSSTPEPTRPLALGSSSSARARMSISVETPVFSPCLPVGCPLITQAKKTDMSNGRVTSKGGEVMRGASLPRTAPHIDLVRKCHLHKRTVA